MKEREQPDNERLVEDVDFYFENGLMVLTAEFLLKRGYCCGSGCRHCPYADAPEMEGDQSKNSSSSL